MIWLILLCAPVIFALDATADQFNYPAFKQYPPVYLGPRTELHGNGDVVA